MNFLNFVIFIIYMYLINYVTDMFYFDYRKKIKKDKYLKNIKFNRNWREEYYKNKYNNINKD